VSETGMVVTAFRPPIADRLVAVRSVLREADFFRGRVHP